ncbi:MAG TPA: hypothetical protein VHC48_18825 [Puia sp.]|jgi:hypothetical protein|nr:hypothetical protein [Puia sp.]
MLNAGAGKESRLVITVNDLSVLQQTFSLNGNDYLSLPPVQEVYDGVGYSGTAGEKIWVITYAGRLPYTVLTRKSFLQA